jgi:hypothetical protein
MNILKTVDKKNQHLTQLVSCLLQWISPERTQFFTFPFPWIQKCFLHRCIIEAQFKQYKKGNRSERSVHTNNVKITETSHVDQIKKQHVVQGAQGPGSGRSFSAATADGCMMKILIQEKQQLEREQPRSHHH